MSINIFSHFDGGNIEVIKAERADDIQLHIRPDAGGEHMQWFHFQVCDAAGQDCVFTLDNAGEVSYPEGFKDYQAVCSVDQEHWFRVPTEFDGKRLIIRHAPPADVVYYAYFAPYSLDRHQRLIADALSSERVRADTLCSTPDGHAHTLLVIGEEEEGRKKLWITARQHPGETMAEWWVEGFLGRLLDPEDPVSRRLLEEAVVYLVPNMCIDGGVRGHLRTNAHGRNLNREWIRPCPEQSPEVYYVVERMKETGVDFAFDVHGDEGLPYNFIAGAEGIQSWNEHKQSQLDDFKALLAEISPDFQTEHGYEVDAPGSADLKKCTDFVAETFDCLAMTLEMPFKDSAITPLPETGWSPGRSQTLGMACVDAFWRILPKL
ncbi:M14 family metallopeptidase [Wenzhouxiangella marina]|nr:M14-type cytosolic carboxypeptidase [Wenzhouxiangella marina]MBB6088621.1 murein tripeptide amidase MpaA [Wenzhouxiangella marina]